MPINVLPKNTPRGYGPEPNAIVIAPGEKRAGENEKLQESDLAAQEAQDLWESQEIGNTSWSGEGGDRYSDPD